PAQELSRRQPFVLSVTLVAGTDTVCPTCLICRCTGSVRAPLPGPVSAGAASHSVTRLCLAAARTLYERRTMFAPLGRGHQQDCTDPASATALPMPDHTHSGVLRRRRQGARRR